MATAGQKPAFAVHLDYGHSRLEAPAATRQLHDCYCILPKSGDREKSVSKITRYCVLFLVAAAYVATSYAREHVEVCQPNDDGKTECISYYSTDDECSPQGSAFCDRNAVVGAIQRLRPRVEALYDRVQQGLPLSDDPRFSLPTGQQLKEVNDAWKQYVEKHCQLYSRFWNGAEPWKQVQLEHCRLDALGEYRSFLRKLLACEKDATERMCDRFLDGDCSPTKCSDE